MSKQTSKRRSKSRPSSREDRGRNKPERGERRERERPRDRGRDREEEREERSDRRDKRGRRDRRDSGLRFDSYAVKGHKVGSIEITEVRLALLDDGDSNIVALCSVTFDDALVIGNIRVVDGKNGLFISMPSRKGSDDEYHDIAFPLTAKGREAITEAVLEAYDDAGGR